jgi:hypothetical protein
MRSPWISSFAGLGLFFALFPACSSDGGGGEGTGGGTTAASGGNAGKSAAGASGSATGGQPGGAPASGGQTPAAGSAGTASTGGGMPPGGGAPGSTGGRASPGGAPSGTAGDGASGGPPDAAGSGGAPGGGAGNGGDGGGDAPIGSGGEGGDDPGPGSGGASGDVDPFGIRELYPSASPESEWTSEHWSEGPYEIDGRTDEHDPLGLSGMRGDGSLEVNADAELVMGGSQPRIYVYPGTGGPWKNVEITVYYRRVEDAATAYAGLVVGVRSGEDGHTDSNACDAHTYYARLRHDGAIDFEKELEHPASSTQSRVSPQTVWPPDGELPFDTWIGWKFVIYNLPSGDAVRLEAYRDLTEAEDGGDWVLMNQTVDDGGWSVETECSEHDPSSGESDLVIVEGGTAFIRNTDVTEARYKWFSVREIDAD